MTFGRRFGLAKGRPRRGRRRAWADLASPGREVPETHARSNRRLGRARPRALGRRSGHQRIALALEDDRQAKLREIATLEYDLAELLAQTPYLLLLSIPGINVVSAAEFAGEMGPIGLYASSRSICRRAGLVPSRYQSDRVDRKDGPLLRQSNRSLRQAILTIADNLMTCNDYFRTLSAGWREAGKDTRHSHVKIAGRFCRIAYQMVAGGRVFRHPCCQRRDYILSKLLKFHGEHVTPMTQAQTTLARGATNPRRRACRRSGAVGRGVGVGVPEARSRASSDRRTASRGVGETGGG